MLDGTGERLFRVEANNHLYPVPSLGSEARGQQHVWRGL
jgi:hypothetical protein